MPTPPEFGDAPLAIVTGGAKRIGAAIVHGLAADGWRVLIHCNRSRDEADALAVKIGGEVVAADLADRSCAETILGAAGGRARLLVNNASRFAYDRLDDFTSENWSAHLDINLRAPTLLTRAFAAHLPEHAHGLVINLLDAKLASLNPDYFSYTVSKIALAGVTELAARALAPRIRVNAVAPSITMVSGPQSRENFAEVHAANPLRRGVDVDDIVRAVGFIAASPTLTGQTITLDAGTRLMGLPRDVAYMGGQ